MHPNPRLSFLICCSPRSGSYLLGEALQAAGVGGKTVEYFGPAFEPNIRALVHAEGERYRGFLARIAEHGTSPSGVFGAKAHWFQFDSFASRLATEEQCSKDHAFAAILAAFPNLKCIWLRRRDTLRQAISYDRAAQTNVWWKITGATPAPVADEQFNFNSIRDRLRTIEECEAGWQAFFPRHQIAPLTIWYEDFIANYRSTVESIVQFFGEPIAPLPPLPEPRMQQQADAITDRWARRYQDRLAESERPVPPT